MKDFYGREVVNLKYKDGTLAKAGDVIRWNSYDNEEFTTWTFTGVYQSDTVMYLGGGIGFGNGVGKTLTVTEVLEDAEDNDPGERGVEKVGNVRGLVRYIAKFIGDNDE